MRVKSRLTSIFIQKIVVPSHIYIYNSSNGMLEHEMLKLVLNSLLFHHQIDHDHKMFLTIKIKLTITIIFTNTAYYHNYSIIIIF